MPELSRSAATSVTSPRDDALTPPSESELSAVVVPEAGAVATDVADVELGASPGSADVLATAPAKKKRRRFGVFFWVAATWLVTLVLLAVLAPFLPFVEDPDAFFADAFQTGPSGEHWFGGDAIGRDLFSRTIYGARVSLTVGVVTTFFGLAIGGTLGVVAGYFRGKTDTYITSMANILLAFPPLILSLAIIAFMGQSLRNVIIALSILSIPGITRIARAATLTFSQREFVLAARTLGASHWRVITREVLPNVIPPLASFSLLAIALVIVAEGALAFLGLSVPAPTPTWGGIINEGRDNLADASHISLIPCGVMFLTLLALNYIGDKLRSIFDVKEAGI